ncbi:MAG: sugar phosphate isomerase/epimerase family protein [Planctomycetota bacterium]
MGRLRLGVIVGLSKERSPRQEIEKVRKLGLPTCQLSSWDPALMGEVTVREVELACREFQVEITTIWAGYSGRMVWNFVDGPKTIGLVPPELRAQRVKDLKCGADFAKRLGVGSITTHVGFLPIDPDDERYRGAVDAVREVAQYCAKLSLGFNFETGQETPVTLLRCIEDVGTDNLGINLDPANLILYGMANPVDALDVFGQYVRGVHAKDGEYPTNGRELGQEKALGQGKVNFQKLIPKLKGLGYAGALTIEREIGGDQQIRDILMAKEILEKLC